VEADEADRSDALRRRLYAPDATAEDLAAFRATQAAPPSTSPPREAVDPVPPPTVDGRHGHRGRVLAAVGGVLLVAAVVGALLTTRSVGASIAPTTAASPRVAEPDAQARIPASSAARMRFAMSLQMGDHAGILDYFLKNPTALPPMLRTPRHADSTEYSGQGSSTIALDPSALAEHGGRVTVVLVTDRTATFSWDAGRIAQHNDRSGPVVTLASHAGSAQVGEPVSVTFRYTGSPPARLSLYLDDTVKWGAVVVFTD
jgi:hypothetical protein